MNQSSSGTDILFFLYPHKILFLIPLAFYIFPEYSSTAGISSYLAFHLSIYTSRSRFPLVPDHTLCFVLWSCPLSSTPTAPLPLSPLFLWQNILSYSECPPLPSSATYLTHFLPQHHILATFPPPLYRYISPLITIFSYFILTMPLSTYSAFSCSSSSSSSSSFFFTFPLSLCNLSSLLPFLSATLVLSFQTPSGLFPLRLPPAASSSASLPSPQRVSNIRHTPYWYFHYFHVFYFCSFFFIPEAAGEIFIKKFFTYFYNFFFFDGGRDFSVSILYFFSSRLSSSFTHLPLPLPDS